MIRLYCAVPPLIFGALLGKLDVIFTVAGLFGFALEFIIPTIYHLLSTRILTRRFGAGAETTPYTGWYSRKFWVWLTLVVGMAACIAAITFTILSWI